MPTFKSGSESHKPLQRPVLTRVKYISGEKWVSGETEIILRFERKVVGSNPTKPSSLVNKQSLLNTWHGSGEEVLVTFQHCAVEAAGSES